MKGEIRKDELDKLAKVEFTQSDIAELVDFITLRHEQFDSKVPDFMLEDAPIVRRRPATVKKEVRRAFVEAVADIWSERRQEQGRQGRSAFASKGKRFDGPLLRLLQALFVAMGEKPPSPSTLYDDIMFLEQREKRKQRLIKASFEQLPPGLWILNPFPELGQERKRDSKPERRRQRKQERKQERKPPA